MVAFWGILLGIAGAVPTALIYLGALPAFNSVPWAFAGVMLLTGLAGGLGYAALFGLIGLGLQGRLPWPLRAVTAVGKRSLTFLSLVLSGLMERRGVRGPAEVLLRKLMVGRRRATHR